MHRCCDSRICPFVLLSSATLSLDCSAASSLPLDSRISLSRAAVSLTSRDREKGTDSDCLSLAVCVCDSEID